MVWSKKHRSYVDAREREPLPRANAADTPEKRKLILASLAAGMPIKAAVVAAGMSYQSLANIRDADIEFDKQCSQARAQGGVAAFKAVKDHAQTDPATARFVLTHALPEAYNRRDVLANRKAALEIERLRFEVDEAKRRSANNLDWDAMIAEATPEECEQMRVIAHAIEARRVAAQREKTADQDGPPEPVALPPIELSEPETERDPSGTAEPGPSD